MVCVYTLCLRVCCVLLKRRLSCTPCVCRVCVRASQVLGHEAFGGSTSLLFPAANVSIAVTVNNLTLDRTASRQVSKSMLYPEECVFSLMCVSLSVCVWLSCMKS